jgi:hypothetical protein
MPRLSFTLAVLAALPLMAEDVVPATFKEALTEGKTSVFLRGRSEVVDQEGVSDTAIANTFRIALGYTTKAFYGVSASLQYEGVYDLGGSSYNHPDKPDATRPTVLDYTSTNELQQAWLAYSSPQVEGLMAKFGRQEIGFDNQRWIGPVGWRQDWQSFDAFRVDYAPKSGPLASVNATYAYLGRVNRIFPEDSVRGDVTMHGTAVNVAWKSCQYLTLTGYGYFNDFENGSFSNNLSSKTIGLRGNGAYPFAEDMRVLYTAEYAKQQNFADNPLTIDQPYYLAEVGVGWKSLALSLGYEVLGGDSTEAGNVVNTPLATVHAHNGWADVFAASTPAGGIKDTYVKVGGGIPSVKGLKALALYHQFKAYDGDFAAQDYGTEMDLLVEYNLVTIDPKWMIGAKYASYSADDLSVDVTKYWVYSQYAF